MCGIYGIIQPDSFSFRELSDIGKLLHHRGPDDEGVVLFESNSVPIVYSGEDTPKKNSNNQDIAWFPDKLLPNSGFSNSGGLALGHRRLSIIDLSPSGHQPMSFKLGRYWITYNGEIYNYIELRNELSKLGCNFSTHSDTEVILAAYSYWGRDCLKKFNGMWAFAIYDQVSKELFMARDRFGVKPLYYLANDSRVVFASEIKAFTKLKDWKPRANTERLLDFIVWNVMDHTNETMFEGVNQLPPGHFACINISGVFKGDGSPAIRPERWYSLPSEGYDMSGPNTVDGLFPLLEDSVRLRLRADVPVGSCLSGGLDSSAIVCIMSKQFDDLGIQDKKLHTFTARSRDLKFDEFSYALAVINKTQSHSHEITPVPSGLFDDLEALIWHQDEPFVSTSIYAQWRVFGAAKQAEISVMLDGQGADEILGGYRGYFGAHLAGILRRLDLLSWMREVKALHKEIGFSFFRLIGYSAAYLMPNIIGLLGRFDGRAYADRDWLAPNARHALANDPFLAAGARPKSVHQLSKAQITATNLPMLLHWEDRNSMAHSIEARVPFLDYRVVEYCLNISDSGKVGSGISKRPLRQAMRGLVPDIVLDRRDKMGFVTSEERWMSRDEPKRFRAALADAISRMPNILSPKLLLQFDEMVAGKRPFDFRYWRAISAAQWVKIFSVEIPIET